MYFLSECIAMSLNFYITYRYVTIGRWKEIEEKGLMKSLEKIIQWSNYALDDPANLRKVRLAASTGFLEAFECYSFDAESEVKFKKL